MLIADWNPLVDRFEKHLRILRGLSSASVKSYRSKVEEFLLWGAGERAFESLTDIKRETVEAYLEHLFRAGNSNQTRNTKLTALQHFFRWLVYEREIERDVTADIPRPKLWKKFVQKFTKAEVLKLFAACDIRSEKGIRDASLMILMAFGGLRDGEAVNLTMDDIVDDGTNIDVNIPDGKQHAYRTVYIWKSPSVILRELVGLRIAQGASPTDRLIVSYRRGDTVSGHPLTQTDVVRWLKKLADQAGVKKTRIYPHMLRATHVSDLRYVQGYDIAAIAERVGHKNISTTDRYLPSRGRIHRQWPSLAAYWSEFSRIWSEK